MQLRHRPRLIDNQLFSAPAKCQSPEAIEVEPAVWFEWLNHPLHSSFSCQASTATISIRREQKRNGWYCSASHAFDGKLYNNNTI